MRDEIACALRLAPSVVTSKLHTAAQLVDRLPATLDLVEAGAITFSHARVLVEAVLALGRHPRQPGGGPGPGPGAARNPSARSGRRCTAPCWPSTRPVKRNSTAGNSDRRLMGRPAGSGMGELWALLGVDDLAAVLTRLDTIAARRRRGRAIRRPTPRRRLVALLLGTALADLDAVACWRGRAPRSRSPSPRATLLGLDDQPGEWTATGRSRPPGPRDRVRPPGGWRRLLTADPAACSTTAAPLPPPPQPLPTRHRPRRTCRFPGCTRPARRCEIDHQLAWDDSGTTGKHNCETLCPRHHHLKHEAGWTVAGDPAGTLTWTSSTGHTYRAPPGSLRPPDQPDEPPPF